MKTFISICLLLASSLSVWSQLPQTEIWVFDLKLTRQGYSLSNPTQIKVGPEYNNQPWFTQDGEMLYFVSNGKKGGPTDIYQYDFNKKRRNIKRLTYTKKEAEYSPKLTPDGTRLSCVRVAADTVTQNFCTYDLKGKKPQILFPEIKTFGYYCWKSQIDLLAFHIPEPFQLTRHNIPYKKQDSLATHIGRCIENVNGKILYVDKKNSTQWTIKLLNNKHLGNRNFTDIPADQILTKTLEGSEDFALIRGKDILMGKNGMLYIKKNIFKESNTDWQAVFDLNAYKIYNFHRIAVSPAGTRLAVVKYSDDEP